MLKVHVRAAISQSMLKRREEALLLRNKLRGSLQKKNETKIIEKGSKRMDELLMV